MLLANQHTNCIENLLDYCKGEMAWAQVKQAYFANCYKTPPLEMHVGDQIWLNTHSISMQRPIKSLNYKNLSPYQIKQVINKGAIYKPKLLPVLATHRIWPVFYL